MPSQVSACISHHCKDRESEQYKRTAQLRRFFCGYINIYLYLSKKRPPKGPLSLLAGDVDRHVQRVVRNLPTLAMWRQQSSRYNEKNNTIFFHWMVLAKTVSRHTHRRIRRERKRRLVLAFTARMLLPLSRCPFARRRKGPETFYDDLKGSSSAEKKAETALIFIKKSQHKLRLSALCVCSKNHNFYSWLDKHYLLGKMRELLVLA